MSGFYEKNPFFAGSWLQDLGGNEGMTRFFLRGIPERSVPVLLTPERGMDLQTTFPFQNPTIAVMMRRTPMAIDK